MASAEGPCLCQGQEAGHSMHVLQEAGIPLGKSALPAPLTPPGPCALYENLD